MNELRSRLMRCFTAVLPQISEQEIAASRLDQLRGWDSVAAATLLSTIEEEFAIELDLDALGTQASFPSILDYLTKTAGR